MKLDWAIKRQTKFSIDKLKMRHRRNNNLTLLIHRTMSCELTINPRIYLLSSTLDNSWNYKLKPSSSQKSKSQNKTEVTSVSLDPCFACILHITPTPAPAVSKKTCLAIDRDWLFNAFLIVGTNKLVKNYVQNFTQVLQIHCQKLLRTQKKKTQRKLNKRGPLRVSNQTNHIRVKKSPRLKIMWGWRNIQERYHIYSPCSFSSLTAHLQMLLQTRTGFDKAFVWTSTAVLIKHSCSP